MRAARFVISLTDTANPEMDIRREVKAAGADRAVIFAQKWLARARDLSWYFALLPDTFCVYEVRDDGSLTPVANGVDRHAPRPLGSKTPKRTRKKSTVPFSRNEGAKTSTSSLEIGNKTRRRASSGLPVLPKTTPRARLRRPTLKASLALMYANMTAERIPRVELPPLGSNTNH